MSFNKQNKPVIAVVGAGPGIGEAVARRFAVEGYVTALLARTEDKLQSMWRGTIIFTGATGSLRGMPGLSSFSPGKFGLRSLAQIITREYQSKGIHTAHIIIDGPVDGKLIGGVKRRQWIRDGDKEKLEEVDAYIAQPDDLAQIYWFLHSQPRSSWTQELDARAQKESMFSKL
ncbi:hypothetical protein ZTR_05844 [Talaromyces verruculosus]|nr:hypothetical protein ZTR_05844 [Talaromyces verruculosus]